MSLWVVLSGIQSADAHPHVFIDANLEIVRDDAGRATHIRHVWRFDEFFSSSLVLDFDDNGNGELDKEEVENIRSVTESSLAEYNYYTEIRKGDEIVEFLAPDPYLADFKDGQLTLILSLELKKPVKIGPTGFKVAVSDPTYYVAVDFTDESSILVSGNGAGCSSEIVRPDFDALYERDADRLTKLFNAAPGEKVEGSEDYLTWVNLKCPE